jgi:hypothetical protein
MWWQIPVIPVLRGPKKDDHGFKASMGYIVRFCLKRRGLFLLFKWWSTCIANPEFKPKCHLKERRKHKRKCASLAFNILQ